MDIGNYKMWTGQTEAKLPAQVRSDFTVNKYVQEHNKNITQKWVISGHRPALYCYW